MTTISSEGSKVIPTTSIEVNEIVKRFKDQPPGTSASYQDLRKQLSCSQARLYGYLSSARNILRRKHSIWLETVRQEGVRVATEDGKLVAMSSDMTRGSRAYRTAHKKAEIINYEGLTDDTKRREYIARSNAISALRLLTAPSAVTQLVKSASTEMLPSGKVLDLFRS